MWPGSRYIELNLIDILLGRLFQRNDDHNIKSAKLVSMFYLMVIYILWCGDGGDGGDVVDDHDDNACQESERGCHQDLQSAGAQSVFISAPTYSFPLIHISHFIVFHIQYFILRCISMYNLQHILSRSYIFQSETALLKNRKKQNKSKLQRAFSFYQSGL